MTQLQAIDKARFVYVDALGEDCVIPVGVTKVEAKHLLRANGRCFTVMLHCDGDAYIQIASYEWNDDGEKTHIPTQKGWS